MKIRLTRAASDEIRDIYGYLPIQSPSARAGFQERLLQVLRDIRDFPETGRATDKTSVRIQNTRPYPSLIYYRTSASEVVRVLHGARDPKTLPARPR
ncbi:type II toxin-antitoxin system RelE/ParE family toxin [Aquibium microcysteis]|uniref:type II toxin-antitoxin system RelE/ParE family toxin n=1 Tax=Aquibium microcysteis TaxID=675281 RepID=UPI00165D221D